MTRRFFVLFLNLFLAFLPFSAAADLLAEIEKRGTLKIGVSIFTPWTMQDDKGNLTGFEIDVGKRLAADIGVEPEFVVYEWEAIIPALKKGEIDLIAAGMAITPDRAKHLNFSLPYMTSGVTLVAGLDQTKDVASLDQLNTKPYTVVSVKETLADDVAGTLFDGATLKHLDTAAEAEAMVLEGKAHAYVASVPEAQFFALQNPGKVDLPLEKPLMASKAGFGVRKGDYDWLSYLNAWVVSHEADGWLSTTYNYWFRSLKWSSQP